VRGATADRFEWRALDRVAVAGREAGTDIHQLLCRKGELAPRSSARRDAYEAALSAYLDGRFAEAAQRFRDLADDDKDDIAATTMFRRARKLARTPPDGTWSGIYVMTRK
jgi:adenylate cyclase